MGKGGVRYGSRGADNSGTRGEGLLCREMVGKHVRLCRDMVTVGGARFAKGEELVVMRTHRGTFTLESPTRKTGLPCANYVVAISQVARRDFELIDGRG